MFLAGDGPQPLFHFGMNGSAASKDGDTRKSIPLVWFEWIQKNWNFGKTVVYRRKPRKIINEEGTNWPPPYWKTVVTFDDKAEWASLYHTTYWMSSNQ